MQKNIVSISNLPNYLTLFRVFIVPIIVFLFFLSKYHYDIFALSLFVVACITDYLDGYIARHMNLISKFGSFLDPVADKLLVASCFLILTYRSVFLGIDVLFVFIIIFRDIFVSELRNFVKFPVSKLAKWKTVFQMLSIFFYGLKLFDNLVSYMNIIFFDVTIFIGDIFLYIAAIHSLISCVNYVFRSFDSLTD